MELTRRQILRASLGALAAGACGLAAASPVPPTPSVKSKGKLQLHAVYADVPEFRRMAQCCSCGHRVPLETMPQARIVCVDVPKPGNPSRARVVVAGSRCDNCDQAAWTKAMTADYVIPLVIPFDKVPLKWYYLDDEIIDGKRLLRFLPHELERREADAKFSPFAGWYWKAPADLRLAACRGDKHVMRHMPYDMLVAAFRGETLKLPRVSRVFYGYGPVA